MKRKEQIINLLKSKKEMYISEIARKLNSETAFIDKLILDMTKENIITKRKSRRKTFVSLVTLE